MWIQIEPDTWLNTDHIIVVDLKRGVLATTPSVQRTINVSKDGIQALKAYIEEHSEV
jgi:hypothetical protein